MRLPVVALLLAVCGAVAEQSSMVVGQDSVFQVGEELTYNVSYAFIDIGQVRIRLVDKTTKDGKTLYRAKAFIDSYKGVPFVSLHTTYESVFTDSLYAEWFEARVKGDDGKWEKFVYNFDYASGKVFVEVSKEESGAVDRRDTLSIGARYQDGLSLLFLARADVESSGPVNVPVVVNEKKAGTYLNFRHEVRGESIDAAGYQVEADYFTGSADFVGVFGLTGDFEGWFSHDAAHVPVLAKMKVIIGNIRLELMKWKRGDWKPPRHAEDEKK